MFLRWLPLSCSMGVLVFLCMTASEGQDQRATKSIILQDRVIAGSPKDSLEVRHLVLKGSNEEIGRTLAQLAKDRYQVQPQPSQDRLRTRAQRRYMEKNFPILHERMKGVASAFGKDLSDDKWNFCDLDFSELQAGCSVMYFPPGVTTTGTGIVSRDYDFSTGAFEGGPVAPGKLHPTARPYLLELHPDRGYASLSMVAYDLLSGVLDGINSEGLTVALLADDELMRNFQMEPTRGSTAGLGALQTLRMLLDTCANVEQAKEALLLTKQYYEFLPVHYLIADRFGKSFLWEYSHAHNKEYIIENAGQPLVTTNFSHHRYLENNKPPSASKVSKVCSRYCLLTEQLAAHSGKMSEDFIKATHKKVDATQPSTKAFSRPLGRTLWHALYYPEQRRVQINYYLRDESIPGEDNKMRIVRSDYIEVQLK